MWRKQLHGIICILKHHYFWALLWTLCNRKSCIRAALEGYRVSLNFCQCYLQWVITLSYEYRLDSMYYRQILPGYCFQGWLFCSVFNFSPHLFSYPLVHLPPYLYTYQKWGILYKQCTMHIFFFISKNVASSPWIIFVKKRRKGGDYYHRRLTKIFLQAFDNKVGVEGIMLKI